MVVRNAKRKVNNWDIVYFVKESAKNEELRYSLRSLKNFPHGKVWFYGGCPKDLMPDYHIYVNQDQSNKWQNVHKMLVLVCNNPKISEEFWLFNDDFYVMKPIKQPKNYYNGDLYKRIVDIEDKHHRITPYTQQLRNSCKELEALGCDTKNYTLHTPMLINKQKAKELFNITNHIMFRSIYGNYFNAGQEQMSDVKIVNPNKLWENSIYLSSDDKSFEGLLGEQIRAIFNKPCKYEK